MKRKISAFKVKKSGIYNSIKPIFATATLEPIWSGKGYELIIRYNFLAKLLTVVMFPVNVICAGIFETIRETSNDLKTGCPCSCVYEENTKHFDKAKELYESAK